MNVYLIWFDLISLFQWELQVLMESALNDFTSDAEERINLQMSFHAQVSCLVMKKGVIFFFFSAWVVRCCVFSFHPLKPPVFLHFETLDGVSVQVFGVWPWLQGLPTLLRLCPRCGHAVWRAGGGAHPTHGRRRWAVWPGGVIQNMGKESF